jgi:hypothetical protein
LIGNFSLGAIAFLIMLPVVALIVALGFLVWQAGSPLLIAAFIGLAMIAVAVVTAFSSTADSIFKALLFTYATGRTVPEGIDTDRLAEAFRSKR